MFFRLQLITLNIASVIFLFFFLCLGSQNLDRRHSLNLVVNETVELPNGFIMGMTFTLGFISGGLTSILNIKDENIIEN